MKETEVEVTEEEVERIYCDSCGSDCTDEYRVEPSHVCTSCSDETAVDKVSQLMSDEGVDEGTGWLDTILMSILFPMVLIIIGSVIVDSDYTDDRETMKIVVFCVLGMILWTVLPLTLVLL